ncbi:hypothetical protein A2Y85_01325 [candidate division WOR-3 bacterium RBG_13_43_14]|uniref:Soluble ligand binding domain-containing protein n=1 Tax=candidate division WOR-3 bacterium RBG_13_43_14 TaxID=1802590 RepID=A0A1F4UEG0_UNCW3|nr:MAG: hypothetical protein A2Y85_01325 [candidate division WOR-3 bacterium RBG_13_43_14]
MIKKYISAIYCIIFTLLLIKTAYPQEIPASSGLERPIVSEEYILMPGDSILITITGATNYSYLAGVTYEGKITIEVPVTSLPTAQGVYVPKYDVVAAVPMYGLTLKDARDSMQVVFSRYYRNVNTDITLIGMRRFNLFVIGEVKYPETIWAYPVDRVSIAINRAGGISTVGSRSHIELRRNGKLHALVNLEAFEKTGDGKYNPYVQDGDILYVPRMAKSVIVKGAVFGRRGYELRVAELTAARERTSEGIYELLEDERISDFIAKAGGTTPWADLRNSYIEREDNKIAVDLSEIIRDIESEENILMQDADVLVIPSINALVFVQGQVVNPGAFTFQPNLTASDYIGLAGGPLSDAFLSGTYVQREKKKISSRKNPIIEEGDRIYVPRQIFKFWQDYVEIGAVFASLLISYLTLTAK